MLSGIHTTHGGSKSREYRAWAHMKGRCYDLNDVGYRYYGGRGISVCERWIDSFENFIADMGKCPKGLSLDRIEVNGNYKPSNCRWATSEQQLNNKTNSRKYTIDNETLTITQWARRFGVPYRRTWSRPDRGLTIEEALGIKCHV